MSIQASFQVARKDFELKVELEIPSTGVTAIYGDSGSGKTTLLRAIAGLDRHSSGMFSINGDVWQDQTTFLPPHRRLIGFVFQDSGLFPHLTVRKNLEYGHNRIPKIDRTISLDDAIKLLDIERLLDRYPHNLSGGERQRVSIARALSLSPSLLLMDEPLASLDDNFKQEIMPYIHRLSQELKIPILYVTHSFEEICRLADHLVLLENGRVKASGEINEILTRLDLPLSSRLDASSIIFGVPKSFDERYHLTSVSFNKNLLIVPGKMPEHSGNSVRLRILARDVSLTVEPQTQTSIMNILPSIIDELVDVSPSQKVVKLKAGDATFTARITRKSAVELGLKSGMRIWSQIKGVALQY